MSEVAPAPESGVDGSAVELAPATTAQGEEEQKDHGGDSEFSITADILERVKSLLLGRAAPSDEEAAPQQEPADATVAESKDAEGATETGVTISEIYRILDRHVRQGITSDKTTLRVEVSEGDYKAASLDETFRGISTDLKRESVVLSWKDVNFTVQKGTKTILKNVSGYIQPGALCAIMGPSGAGKSSLLNILAGRQRSGGSVEVTGTIMANGKPVDPQKFRKRIAYVMQEDALFATQTPREAFTFSARLRLSKSISDAQITNLVDAMLSALGLNKCADTMIGNVMIKGISGGEKKRTAIGVELISNPDILFLDEPTSGLDSYAAHQVVKILKKLARSGRTIITTIHQPSSEVFDLFDDTLLLADGRTIYHDKVEEMTAYFARKGHICPAHYNPADFIMFMMQMESKASVHELADAWGQKAAQPSATDIETGVTGKKDQNVTRSAAKPGCCRQFRALIAREFQQVIRDKGGMAARIGSTLFLNLIVGFVFQDAANWSDVTGAPGEVRKKLGGHFGAVVQTAIAGMFGLSQPLLLSFPLERPVFMREYAVGTYSAIPYFISKMIVEIPLMIMQSMIIWLCTYHLIGFSGNFFILMLYTALLGLVAASSALLIGSVANNVNVAIQLTPLLFVPQIMFAGFFVPIDSIPAWIRWPQYLCSLKYSINVMMITELENVPNSWPSSLNTTLYEEAVFGCSGSALKSDKTCDNPNEQALFPSSDVEATNLGLYLGILLIVLAIFRLASLVCLSTKASR